MVEQLDWNLQSDQKYYFKSSAPFPQNRILRRSARGVLLKSALVLSILLHFFDGHVLGKPGSVEPLYLELEQNIRNSSSTSLLKSHPRALESLESGANDIPDSIRASLSTFCEKCSEAQKKKVEQILLLLFNFNQDGDLNGNISSSFVPTPSTIPSSPSLLHNAQSNKFMGIDKPSRRKKGNVKKKTFSEPKPGQVNKFKSKSSENFVPTRAPNTDDNSSDELHRVIQLPPKSTTTPASPSSTSSHFNSNSRVLSLYPSYKSTPFPFPSTTVSSALGPVQSVEMPTPPMPPTTSGPVFIYYLNSPRSSSLQPPTTPVDVVESSLASRPTTLEP